jgi:hypothetical protein
VAAGDERLLVRGGHDLAGPQRREDRPQADDPAGRDDDKIDVRVRSDLLERGRAADSPRAAGQVEPTGGRRVPERDDSRSEAGNLLVEDVRLPAGRKPDDPEAVGMKSEDVHRLPPDGSG